MFCSLLLLVFVSTERSTAASPRVADLVGTGAIFVVAHWLGCLFYFVTNLQDCEVGGDDCWTRTYLADTGKGCIEVTAAVRAAHTMIAAARAYCVYSHCAYRDGYCKCIEVAATASMCISTIDCADNRPLTPCG